MAATTAEAPAPTDTAPPRKRRRRKLVVGLLLVVVLAAGGAAYTMRSAKSGPHADPAKEPGAVIDLDPLTLNLSDGRYLKVGLALQLSKAASPAAPAADPSAAGSGFDGAKALDAAIAVLGERSYHQLLAPGGRARAQKQLSAVVSRRYDGAVLQVYFTEFVMQ